MEIKTHGLRIDPAWAEYLTKSSTTTGLTIFQDTMRAVGLWTAQNRVTPTEAAYVAEAFLAIALMSGISRRDYGTGISGTLRGNSVGNMVVSQPFTMDMDVDSWELSCDDWCDQFLPKTKFGMGPGGNAFNISSSEKTNATSLKMIVTANGWAYMLVEVLLNTPSSLSSYTLLLLPATGYLPASGCKKLRPAGTISRS